jgi:acetoacetate decarboxylase
MFMNIEDVRRQAFAMPLTSPAFPPGPYRFMRREFLIVTYRTDMEALRAVVPEPLEVVEPLVKYEFIRMPDSTGFGDYTESGQVIPVQLRTAKGVEQGAYVHAMYLNDHPPIAGGRELWGFPKKLASPVLDYETDVIVGTLDYGKVRVAKATMGFKHRALAPAPILAGIAQPNFLLKIIPHVDGTAAHLRAGALSHGRCHAARRVDRAGIARTASACARTGGRFAGAARSNRRCTTSRT